jgi:hypothetical protein
MPVVDWIQQKRSSFESLPPKQAMRRAVYWGVIIVTAFLIAFTSFYLQQIPAGINSQLDQVFAARSWARPLASVNGRNVVLRGTVEPGLGLDREIDRIRKLPGVRSISNQLDEQPLPSAEIHLTKSADKIDVRGKLTGDDLDQFITAVQRAFPNKGLRDRIRIDDRLGRPLWLDGLESTLATLSKLQNLTLHAWRDAILIDGIASTDSLGRKIKYGLFADLPPEIRVQLQFRIPPKQNQETLSMVAGWNGSAISATVADEQTGLALEQGFFQLAADSNPETISQRVTTDAAVTSSGMLPSFSSLIPALDQVHDLRVESSGDGLIVWGRMDSANGLGQVVNAIEENGLSEFVDNQIYIDPADRSPEISLFRDHTKAIVSGRLPNHRSRENLINALQKTLGVDQIEEFINIEPNISFAPWLDHWPMFKQMPRSAFGMTVADNGVFVSGQVSSWAEQQSVVETVHSMFPEMQLVNWLTIAGVTFQGSRGISPFSQD